jgi:hypothetical protein
MCHTTEPSGRKLLSIDFLRKSLGAWFATNPEVERLLDLSEQVLFLPSAHHTFGRIRN